MINLTPQNQGWHWQQLTTTTETPYPQVWHTPSERVSAVLGPDGEPLKVGYPRPRMGFDLTPTQKDRA